MDDFPWVYAAMIFIAFVSWLHSRIQEAAARRRQRAAEKKVAMESARKERPLAQTTIHSPFRPNLGPTAPAPQPAPQPQPDAPVGEEVTVPRSFREFFEMLETGGRPEAVTEPRPVHPLPPPLPEKPALPAPEFVRRAPDKLQATAAAVVSGAGAEVNTRFSRRLRSRASLREALILKEILDPPLSQR